jgi:hypothetical protein
MKARIGVFLETWNGAARYVMHVLPLDSPEALALDAAERLGAEPSRLRPTLCGERKEREPRTASIALGCKGGRARLVWCPACEKLDRPMRLP